MLRSAGAQRAGGSSHASRLITLGEMASALAHELNQPLTAIRNFSALGLRRLGDHPPEGVRNTLEIIAEQSMRAGEIVRRIRSFVRKGEIRLGAGSHQNGGR